MKFLVITLAPTLYSDNSYHSYAPYVREMDIWFKHIEDVTILSPTAHPVKLLTAPFKRKDIKVVGIPSLAFNSVGHRIKSMLAVPLIFFKMVGAMRRADHIHLRCPGNIALIGCVAQIFFPKKKKTAKYAGNWDPNSKQPLSYRIQKWLLSNTLVTKNMQVLIYGNWPDQSKNIRSFFTASYTKDKVPARIIKDFQQPLKFIFVGSLAIGKNPLLAIKLVEALHKKGFVCTLQLYGEGKERAELERFIEKNNLGKIIFLKGNQSSETVEAAYKQSDFLILPSQSEGWPKVVAEAMWWGVVPIVSKVSCVPWMLGFGERGILLKNDFKTDLNEISSKIEDKEQLEQKSIKAQQWAQNYALEDFEAEIKKLL